MRPLEVIVNIIWGMIFSTFILVIGVLLFRNGKQNFDASSQKVLQVIKDERVGPKNPTNNPDLWPYGQRLRDYSLEMMIGLVVILIGMALIILTLIGYIDWSF